MDVTFLPFLASKRENEKFLEIIQKYLNKTEIVNLILGTNNFGQNSLILASRNETLRFLKAFWNFHNKILEKNEMKAVLIQEDKFFFTALQYSTQNKNAKSFLFVKEIYEHFFTPTEIQKILSFSLDKKKISFLINVIDFASVETALEVSKYLENLFINEKLELRKVLSYRDRNRDTIFNLFQNDKKYAEKLKIFTELLRKTFEENQEKEFTETLRNISR
jgi:hypothetical protein